MEYGLFTSKLHNGKFTLSVKVDGIHFTDPTQLSHFLFHLDYIDDIGEFRKHVKTLKFSMEFDMNRVKDYIESILIWHKLTSE